MSALLRMMMRVAAFSLVLGGATAINTTDVPTFRFSCRVTNSLDGAAPPPPPLRPYPEPPCTLNATICPTQHNGWPDFTCHGSTCWATNYSFSLGCGGGPCTGVTGVETSSGEPPPRSPHPSHPPSRPDNHRRDVRSGVGLERLVGGVQHYHDQRLP